MKDQVTSIERPLRLVDGFDVKEWLNEIVAYSGLDEYLQPTGVIRRFQRIERVRRNGRGRGKAIKVVAAEIFEHFKKR